jgi:hypothetical protein
MTRASARSSATIRAAFLRGFFSLPIGDVYSLKYIADPRSIPQATRTQQTQDGAAAGGCVSYTLGSNRLMRKPE